MGGPRKLNQQQAPYIEKLRGIHEEEVHLRRQLRQEFEEAFHKRAADIEYRKSRAMNEAIQLGIPKAVVQRATGETNWHKFKEILALTENEVSAAPIEKLVTGDGFTFDPNTGLIDVDAHWLTRNEFGSNRKPKGTRIIYAEAREGKDWEPRLGYTENLRGAWRSTFDLLIPLYYEHAGPNPNQPLNNVGEYWPQGSDHHNPEILD